MPRDPFAVLGVPLDANGDSIKAAWRKLARENHPDVNSGDTAVEKGKNKAMAEINAAYHELRDPDRRRSARESAARARARAGDSSAWRARYYESDEGRESGAPFTGEESVRTGSVRPARPVTARIDTSALLRPRNGILNPLSRSPLPGLPPRPRSVEDREPPRASTPTGPTHKRRGPDMEAELPTLSNALAAELNFGKFAGLTLADVAALEPSYIEWMVRTIARDPDITLAARVVLRHLLTSGPIRRPRLDTAIPRR
jgi:curved DNA-binding protein CbpA